MPFPYDKYPWLNFHEINLAYFIKHFREIFQQWDSLLNKMHEWKDATDAELTEWKSTVEAGISSWEAGLQQSMEDWKNQTKADISTWEATTLAALDAWKTATTAVFEQIRTDAAASAQAAAGSATSAQTALAGAQAAQTAAETAAAGIQSSLAQIQANTSSITDLTAESGILFEPIEFTFAQGTLNSVYGTITPNNARIYSSYLNDIESIAFDVPLNYDYNIFFYSTPVELHAAGFISSTGWISGVKVLGTDIAIPQSSQYIRFIVRFHDGANISPSDFADYNIFKPVDDADYSQFANYTPSVIYLCRDGRVTENVPPNSKYAIKMTAENQYDKVRISVSKTTDGYFVAVHDTYINDLAVNLDGTPISTQIRTQDCTLAELNHYDWGLKYDKKYQYMRVPMLDDALRYAAYYGLSVALDIKWSPTEPEIESICDALALYGHQNAILFAVSIPNMQKFLTYCPNLSYSFAGTIEQLTSQAGSLKLLRNGYNTIYADYRPIGYPAPAEFITIARQNGLEIKITEIDSIEDLFTNGYGHGATLIECNNITSIKKRVRDFAKNLVFPVT